MNHFTPYAEPRIRDRRFERGLMIVIAIVALWDICAVAGALAALDRQYAYEDRR